jgi:hypothetical protein
MRSRFRIEIFDEIKANDLTLYAEDMVDKTKLNQIVFNNLYRFKGNVRAFVYDNAKKRKVTYLVLPLETVAEINKKTRALV